MKRFSPIALSLAALIYFPTNSRAQENKTAEQSRPRTVTTIAQQTPKAADNKAAEVTVSNPVPASADAVATESSAANEKNPVTLHLSPSSIQARITEAERMLKSRPLHTAMTTPSIEFVTIAALDRNSSKIHLVTISKQTFLKKGSEVTMTSSLGTPLTIRILRANGVNTALTVFTPEGHSLVPLVAEYPIERKGLFLEMAYYTSAHPALLSPDLTRSGQHYVRNMLDLAAKKLKDKGVFISPQIIDVAERLCIVEHVDHDRFKNENRLALYNEIYSLFSLNEIDTYRYSVSVAGAGGMIQMIPWAYNLQRQRYPGVGLIPDFVVGMRNHGNALQAMLLYMQDTWNQLISSEDVQSALNSKIATPSELLAAGYNSNSAKLPGYIRRGGADWKFLIPRETQMYLQIYKSFESLVPMKTRAGVITASRTN